MSAAPLGVVIIGRNPGADLVRVLSATAQYPFAETIFADSGSTDGSSAVATALGARVVTVPQTMPGAAAARAAGTLAVEGADWILYLDSDMVPDLEAVATVHAMLATLPRDVAGVTGPIRDRYPDGAFRVRHAHERSGGPATYFGGAVVLRRSAVLEVGNWNPLVVANEELDLHARLRAAGMHLQFERLVLVDHFTSLQRAGDKLAMLANWRGRGGARYGAPGLALRSCLSRGAATQLILLSPEPFVATPLTLVAIGLAFSGKVVLGGLLLAALWIWISWRRGWQYLAPSYLLFPQIIVGMLRYGTQR